MAYQQPYGQQQQYGGQPFQQPGFNPQYGGQQYGGQQGYQGQAPPPPGFVPPPSMPRYMPTPNNVEQGGQPGYGGDSDGPFKYSLHFNEKSIRMAFIRKVFFLVTIMLGVVSAITALPFVSKDVNNYFRDANGRVRNLGWFYASYGTFFVTYLVLVCCEGVRRSFPMNLILTGVFTLATGFMTMCISMQFTIESVLMALVITTACCGVIILFAMQTKYDLTSCMGVMALLSLFLMVFGIIAIIGMTAFNARVLYTIYAGLGALMFMAYLAIDVQMLMGGRKYEISPEDHIFAAIQLFLDIIQIFWFILSLFGSRD